MGYMTGKIVLGIYLVNISARMVVSTKFGRKPPTLQGGVEKPKFVDRSLPDVYPMRHAIFSQAIQGNPLTCGGKNRMSQGVENRGSLISMPLALRVLFGHLDSAE